MTGIKTVLWEKYGDIDAKTKLDIMNDNDQIIGALAEKAPLGMTGFHRDDSGLTVSSIGFSKVLGANATIVSGRNYELGVRFSVSGDAGGGAPVSQALSLRIQLGVTTPSNAEWNLYIGKTNTLSYTDQTFSVITTSASLNPKQEIALYASTGSLTYTHTFDELEVWAIDLGDNV